MITETHVADMSLLVEHRSAGMSGPPETGPGSRRREANSPDVSCLCGTWEPR